MGTVVRMGPIITAVMLLAAGSFFAFTMLRRIAPSVRAPAREGRLDRPCRAARGAPSLRVSGRNGSTSIARSGGPASLHVIVFAAFLILALPHGPRSSGWASSRASTCPFSRPSHPSAVPTHS